MKFSCARYPKQTLEMQIIIETFASKFWSHAVESLYMSINMLNESNSGIGTLYLIPTDNLNYNSSHNTF